MPQSPQAFTTADERARLVADAERIVARATAENRALSVGETALFEGVRAQISELDAEDDYRPSPDRARRAALATERRSDGSFSAADTGLRAGYVADRDGVYTRGGPSYFRDLLAERMHGDPDARERLWRHGQEMDRRLADPKTEQRWGRAWVEPQEQRTNPNRTDGQGGYFVPPAWLIDQYVTFARFGRALTDLCTVLPLPAGTDTVNLPALATGTAVAIQTADAAPVSSVDFTDIGLTAPVRTIAGQQDIALQLLEQSPINVDEVIFRDLAGDYDAKLDVQVINGSGAGGQLSGLLTVSGTNNVTYTDATPTLQELWPFMAQAVSRVASLGKVGAPTAVVIAPAIWGHWFSQLDTTGRPLMSSPGTGPTNALGSLQITGDAGDQGLVGTIGPMRLVVDGNIPANLGGGSNESRLITARFPEIFLWEGVQRMRVLQDVLSGTLQLRLQLYSYMGLIANRRPAAVSFVSGTGMVPQSGF